MIRLSTHQAQQAILSFDGYLTHSGLSGTQKTQLRHEFKDVSHGRVEFSRFSRHLPSEVPDRRVCEEAWNALRFPSIGHFFHNLNTNPHLDSEKKSRIAHAVREALFKTHDSPTMETGKIHEALEGYLQPAAPKHGWEKGNISWVREEVETLCQASSD